MHLVSISNSSNDIKITAGVTGTGQYESTVGTRVESVTFDASYSTTWDLTGALTLTGTSSNETLYGTAYDDTMYGLDGGDTIWGNSGNDTLIGGNGNDTLRGGTGNDTYKFGSGWGADSVIENTSQGTDTIYLTGINPNDIRLYTSATSGNLHIVSISNPSDDITVSAGVTGSNQYESTIGSYVESITFDAGYSTTWDLTGALTLTGTSSTETLYGTAYNDTIYALGNNDNIWGNGGNDTLVGGTGNDTLRGGTGNDTYTFASGWGADSVIESTSSGTDTIFLTGINPNDIRLYTDTSGTLHIVSISSPSDDVAVSAGVGGGQYESTIGSYVESITFDAGYSTTWSLTSGLTLTGTTSGQQLYGTAYADTIDGMGGADTIYGNGGNDTLLGGSSGDTLRGGNNDDLLQGNGGTDNLYGESGADTFMFKAATALSASDNIQDFSTGAGDKIDISDVISGYDPLSHAITDWVQITTSGANSLLKVDTDGTANGTSWTQIATIMGVTGLTDEAALVANGNLIAHAA